MPGDRLFERRLEVGQALSQPPIVDAPARGLQFLGKVAHCGEDQRQLLLVMIDIARFGQHFGHQDHIAARIGSDQRRHPWRELIAKDQDQRAAHDRGSSGIKAPVIAPESGLVIDPQVPTTCPSPSSRTLLKFQPGVKPRVSRSQR